MATPPAVFVDQTGPKPDSDSLQPQVPFKFEDELELFNSTSTAFQVEQQRVTARREARKNRINVAELRNRSDKPILSDETVIPDRTIDFNMRIEKAPYVKVIEQATTILEFEDTQNPARNYTPLSAWHTRLMRVGDWKHTKFMTVDSLLLHGCAFREVLFSNASPSKTTEEYIRREDLIFPPHVKSLQACGRIYRRYEVTKSQFSDLAKQFGFAPDQVAKINENVKGRTDAFYIYKTFMRAPDGVINVAWMGDKQNGPSDYLKPPTPLDIGLVEFSTELDPVTQQPLPPRAKQLREFPLFEFPYHIEEDEEILNIQGRAALDLATQDAMTSLISGTVNGTTRASRFYPSRKTPPGETPRNEALFPLRHGFLHEGDISVFQPDYPNNVAISVANMISSRKAQEIGATDYAAMNRQDTRKTATELVQAQESADSLAAPNISLYTLCEFRVETLRWQILVDQLRLESTIQLLQQIPPEQQQFSIALPPGVPLAAILSPTLTYTMAADAQVVRRAQRQSRYMQYWPVVAPTPYALPFLETMLADIFPEEFIAWQQQIQATDQTKQLLAQTLPLLSQLTPQQLPPGTPPEQFAGFLDTINATVNPQAAQQNANAAPA